MSVWLQFCKQTVYVLTLFTTHSICVLILFTYSCIHSYTNSLSLSHTHTHSHTHPLTLHTHSVGTITAIPASVIVDLIIHHFLPSWQAFVGIVLILTGFVGFVISEFREMRQEHVHKKLQKSLKNSVATSISSSDSLLDETKPLLDSKPETGRKWWPLLTKYLI